MIIRLSKIYVVHLWNAHMFSWNPNWFCFKPQSIWKYLCAIHTFGDTFCRATAMPLFKLPTLAAHSIWTNCCTGNNKKWQWGAATSWNMYNCSYNRLDCPPVLESDITCLYFSSYQKLYCGHRDSSANCWKLSQNKETMQIKHLLITNHCLHICL